MGKYTVIMGKLRWVRILHKRSALYLYLHIYTCCIITSKLVEVYPDSIKVWPTKVSVSLILR